jgi:hypothetical protein
MALWDMSSGPHLRGANIWQARVYPDLDGLEFKGPGPVGPPFTQEDFDRLAGLGANYVNISHPGLFSETPPYTPDQNIEVNLDGLLGMIEQADMFAVITFRTGPGRSEFTMMSDDTGTWFDESYLNDSVWEDQATQDAWGEMWRYTAERYRDNPIVVGYDLMVEPNAEEVFGRLLPGPRGHTVRLERSPPSYLYCHPRGGPRHAHPGRWDGLQRRPLAAIPGTHRRLPHRLHGASI